MTEVTWPMNETLLQVFKNKHRPRIVAYLIEKHQGTHVSDVSKKLGISKGSTFVNLSELEAAGVLVHRWALKKKEKTRMAVKIYSLNPKLPRSIKDTIKRLVTDGKPT